MEAQDPKTEGTPPLEGLDRIEALLERLARGQGEIRRELSRLSAGLDRIEQAVE